MLFPRASLQRSSCTRTRKNATSTDVDIFIPELSDNEHCLDITHSPATPRPTQCTPRPLKSVSSRITLSAYTFSIDDALLVIGGDEPGSPALSASSSTTDGASSEGLPPTPGTSDDEDGYKFTLHTPRLHPHRVTIRPLRINKTESLISQEDEDLLDHFDQGGKDAPLPVTREIIEHTVEDRGMIEAAEQADQDFYAHEFEDFISLPPATPPTTSPARRDSFILVSEVFPAAIWLPEQKHRGRSRHSKPLPLLPPTTPPLSTFPSIPTLPLVQTTAQKSVVRRKRNTPRHSNSSPLPPPAACRPRPQMGIPLDIEDDIFRDENPDVLSRESSVIEQVFRVAEDANIYIQPPFTRAVSATVHPFPPAIPEIPLAEMYGEVRLPRASTDSDAPRSSVDSASSFTSSTSSNTPISPIPLPSSPLFEEGLRSRWSSSTLGSLAMEPPRTNNLLSPFKGVFTSRTRRVPPQKTPPHPTSAKFSKNVQSNCTTPSPPKNSRKHVRQQGSRSSTSSAGTTSSENDSHEGSPSGWKKKPMFLRAL